MFLPYIAFIGILVEIHRIPTLPSSLNGKESPSISTNEMQLEPNIGSGPNLIMEEPAMDLDQSRRNPKYNKDYVYF